MPIHIHAEKKDIAPYVLLPGDPNRAEYIAQKFLTSPKLYSDHRKMLGFTGTFEGVPVSVQTSGMGTPSASIITSELFQLGAEVIIRVGTVGGLDPKMNLADLLIVNSAWGSREIVNQITQLSDYNPTPSWELLAFSVQKAEKKFPNHFHIGPVATVNLFYNPDSDYTQKLRDLGCGGCEMEAAALFALASKHKKQAHCILTVSDLIFNPDNFVRASEAKILEGVDKMVEVGLETLVAYHTKKK